MSKMFDYFEEEYIRTTKQYMKTTLFAKSKEEKALYIMKEKKLGKKHVLNFLNNTSSLSELDNIIMLTRDKFDNLLHTIPDNIAEDFIYLYKTYNQENISNDYGIDICYQRTFLIYFYDFASFYNCYNGHNFTFDGSDGNMKKPSCLEVYYTSLFKYKTSKDFFIQSVQLIKPDFSEKSRVKKTRENTNKKIEREEVFKYFNIDKSHMKTKAEKVIEYISKIDSQKFR